MYYYLVKYNNKIIGAYTTKEDAELFINACYQNNFMVDNASIVYCLENSCYYEREVDVPRYATSPKKKSSMVLDPKTRSLFKNANVFLSSLDNNRESSSDIVTTDINIVSPVCYENCTDYQTSEEYTFNKEKQKTNTPILNACVDDTVKPIQNIDNMKGDEPVNIFATPEYIKQTEERTKLQHEINLLKMKKAKLEQSKKVYDTDLNIYNTFKKCSTVVPEIFKKKYDIFKKLEDKNELSWENFISEYSHENMYNDHFNVTYHEAKVTDSNFFKESDNLDTFEIDTDDTTDEN
jgi:hypothetical protein